MAGAKRVRRAGTRAAVEAAPGVWEFDAGRFRWTYSLGDKGVRLVSKDGRSSLVTSAPTLDAAAYLADGYARGYGRAMGERVAGPAEEAAEKMIAESAVRAAVNKRGGALDASDPGHEQDVWSAFHDAVDRVRGRVQSLIQALRG